MQMRSVLPFSLYSKEALLGFFNVKKVQLTPIEVKHVENFRLTKSSYLHSQRYLCEQVFTWLLEAR